MVSFGGVKNQAEPGRNLKCLECIFLQMAMVNGIQAPQRLFEVQSLETSWDHPPRPVGPSVRGKIAS